MTKNSNKTIVIENIKRLQVSTNCVSILLENGITIQTNLEDRRLAPYKDLYESLEEASTHENSVHGKKAAVRFPTSLESVVQIYEKQ